MSHAHKADKLLIKPAAGARPAPPRARTDHSQGTHTAASHPTSHTRHGDTTLAVDPDRPTPRVSQSPERTLRCHYDSSCVATILDSRLAEPGV